MERLIVSVMEEEEEEEEEEEVALSSTQLRISAKQIHKDVVKKLHFPNSKDGLSGLLALLNVEIM